VINAREHNPDVKSKATGASDTRLVITVGTLTEDTEFPVDCNGAICVANTAVPPRGRKPPCLICVFRDEKLTLSAEVAKAGGHKSARGQVELATRPLASIKLLRLGCWIQKKEFSRKR